MFEKDAEDWVKENMDCCRTDNSVNQSIPYFDEEERCCAKSAFQDGAEFGYNKAKAEVEESYKESLCNSELNLASVTEQLEELEKANEWNYVSEKGTPKKEGHYLVCLRNKDKDIFDCWIYYDKDVGWYSMKVRMKDIYAWKEIVPPELKEKE